MITLKNYLTANGAYPDREKNPELTEEYIQNATALLVLVNNLLEELGYKNATVTSGFRPSAVNAKIANAAKKSNHTTCNAVDILDNKNQDLAKLVLANMHIVNKYGLYIEDPMHTIGKSTNWVHFQDIKTKSNPFKP